MTKKSTEDEANKRDDDPTADLEILPEERVPTGEPEDWNSAISELSTEMQMLVESISRKQHDTEELLKLCLSEIELLKSSIRTDSASVPELARKIVACDGRPPCEFAIGPGNVSLGSGSDNDIRIDSTFVSRHHAEIISGPTECVLRDLNSTNGTFVNSKRIKRHALKHGDRILLGKKRFEYIDNTFNPPETRREV